jgi:hypothetical protein
LQYERDLLLLSAWTRAVTDLQYERDLTLWMQAVPISGSFRWITGWGIYRPSVGRSTFGNV